RSRSSKLTRRSSSVFAFATIFPTFNASAPAGVGGSVRSVFRRRSSTAGDKGRAEGDFSAIPTSDHLVGNKAKQPATTGSTASTLSHRRSMGEVSDHDPEIGSRLTAPLR